MGVGMRGPGEKQLETDRRLVERRINDLKTELGKVLKRREQLVAELGWDGAVYQVSAATGDGTTALGRAAMLALTEIRDAEKRPQKEV